MGFEPVRFHPERVSIQLLFVEPVTKPVYIKKKCKIKKLTIFVFDSYLLNFLREKKSGVHAIIRETVKKYNFLSVNS